MELRHLRYFVTVAECGNVSRAASKLFIAQPPLSAQIRQLEQELGVELLVRLPRGVRLTPAGVSFLADARAILARTQQATARARECQSGRRSILRVGLMPSTTHTLLPGLVQRLQTSGLTVDLEAREIMPSTRQLQALRNDEVDLGFIRPGSSSLPPEAVAWIDDPYCLALPTAHPLASHAAPLTLKAAAHASFVSFSRHVESDYFDQTSALCLEAGFQPNIRHEAGQFAGVLTLVSCGLGVAIVPTSCSALAPHNVVLRPLAGTHQRSRLAMVCSYQTLQDDWGQAILEAASAELRALAKTQQLRFNTVKNTASIGKPPTNSVPP
jgi:DNA-binding transcriptional LysR family regulator